MSYPPSPGSAAGAENMSSAPHGTLSAHKPCTSPEISRHPGRPAILGSPCLA
eukprot:CAMPEP_0197607632 /NCGR_PEP_ID=MMETSP1326-20131121/47479_1 /TAXON_ID=1155430 /ORGANISM="Genus nov. species nov., Strain RCC2288" /LENGTH=51 /DNA_ID=CAMNT_0043175707 /DNA_START=129 /DNA_END=281 /DNA_ORIENTATION=+